MFDQKKVKDLVLTSLIADAYSLGSHWVYDEKQLASEAINWNELNKPLAIWHKGKSAGEFTHYGDQTYWLYEFLKDKDSFNENDFLEYWKNKMNLYEGYIDSASRNTLQNIKDGITPSGSNSSDLSITGRITPLLLVSRNKETFLDNVEKLTKLTHNSSKALNASRFFAKLLWEVSLGKDIEDSMINLKDEFDVKIQEHISQGINSKTSDTFKTIRNFGPACDVDEGFAGVIHLLCKYDNLKDMLVCNAKAGGDSSARAMIASVILMTTKSMSHIPQNWLSINAKIE